MAATRYLFHSSLILLIAVFNGCVSEYSQLTIQVSESGHDKLSCLQEPQHACKTLVYVLNQMSNSTFNPLVVSEMLINVTYNQTIHQKLLEVNLHFQYMQKVSVVGCNNAFIIFKYAGSFLQISQLSGYALQWSWIELGFTCTGRSKVHNELDIPRIIMLFLNTLEVYKCNFISVTLRFDESIQGPSIVISENVFGNSEFCPIVKFVITSSAIVANNSFENCRVIESPLLRIQANNNSVKILNNSFTNLSTKISTSAISIIGTTVGISIQNNRFIGNSMGSVTIYVTVSYSGIIEDACTWCIMERNNFEHNCFRRTEKQNPILVVIKAITDACPMKFSCNHNSFENNKNTRLLSTDIENKNNFTAVHNITDLTILNNTGTSGLVTIVNNDPLHGIVIVYMTSLTVEYNTGRYREDTSDSLKATIVYVKNVNQITIGDSAFQKNLGTSLVLENEQFYSKKHYLCVTGRLLFDANSGIYGGAMGLYSVTINSSCHSIVSFQNNYGVYGGALYLENSPSHCVCTNKCLTTLKFNNNRATTSGNSVYFASSSYSNFECKNFSRKDVGSAASSIVLNSADSCCLSIFPGQNIIVNISITDHFNQPSLCTAGVSISCDGLIYTCFNQQIQLSGPDRVVLVQPPNKSSSIIDTNLVLQIPNNNNSRNILLRLSCSNSNANIAIILNISSCPLGFTYDSKLNVCKCATNIEQAICSTALGAVCVSHGYWYGTVHDEYIVARCKYSECKMNNVPCPPGLESGNNYFLLNGPQCSNGRGGVLCRTCPEHFVFSFLSIRCIPQDNCNISKAVSIIFFALIFQILITIFLFLVVRFKHSIGCGFLYGPMLFLAVVNHIPLDDYSEYSTLSTVVSIFTSVALLNLELFGRIPWCFFESIPKLYNYSLRVLGPLTVLLVLLGITALARWYPKCSVPKKIRMRALPQRVLQRCHVSLRLASPLRAMCILMLLSFWSLADISINILTPTVLEAQHYSMYMVSIQPDIIFFSPQHLPLAIPALLVLLVVILPLVIILLSAPFLQRVINLFKIKPFLDEFQSCYKDKYRWYSGVYFVVWIAIVGIQGLPDSLLYTQTILFILLCAQFLIKPYKSKLLNITDTLLLVDLNFLIALLCNNTNPLSFHMFSSLLIHALIIVPFVCAVLSIICLVLTKYGVYDCLKGFWSRRRKQELHQPQDAKRELELSHPEVQDVHVPDVSFNVEREPLIAFVGNK